jgi:hypothetical protein
MAIDLSEIRSRVGPGCGVARNNLERFAFVPDTMIFQVIHHPVVGEVARGEFSFDL